MKQLLLKKLRIIRKEMNGYEGLTAFKLQYAVLQAQEEIIIEIMEEYERIWKAPIIRDIELNYEMGILSPQEKEDQLKNIPEPTY